MEGMEGKNKIDKIINSIAAIAAIAFLIGALVVIWVGSIGIKISLSAIVLLAGDYLAFLWMQQGEKGRGKGRDCEDGWKG